MCYAIRNFLFVGQREVGRRCVNKHPIQLGHESLDVTLAYCLQRAVM